MDNTWRDNIYIQHRRSYQEWTILKRQYLYSAQKKLSRMDNTWRDNTYIEHRRSYQEWTIHEETISTFSTEEAIKNGQYMKRQYLHSAQKKLSRMENTWRDNIYIEHRRSYQEWTIHEETISTLSTEEAIKNGQYMKRHYLHSAQKKLSRMDNTWRDNIYIQHRRSYQEWTIHEETISTFSTEEAIKNGQYMKRQYLHWAQKKLSRMDNTWRDNIYIEHRRSYHEWTIHEETISTFSTEEAIKNGKYTKRQYLHWAQKKLSRIQQYMKRQYLHSAQKKLSRMDNTWRDNIYIQYRRSYQEWTIHEETILTLNTEEAIKNGQYMKRQYLHWAQKKLSRIDNTWRDNIYIQHRRSYQEWTIHEETIFYIQHRRSYQEWTIHEETISTFSTEEAIKNGQYMKRQYLHSAQKKLSRMDNTWRDNIYIQHRRSYQEWKIHEETISTFSTEEAIKNGQYMKRQYLHSAQKKLSRMDNAWRDNIYIQHRRSYQEFDNTLRDNIYIQHRRSYQEWTIHEETISTFSTEEAIKNGQYMKRQYLHWTQKKLSRMDNTWRDNIYIQHRRSYQEWTIHEETILTLSTEEAIKNGQYMKRQYLHSAQKKLSRMDNTWRDNIYIQHRRSYQEWKIHEETISTLSTEEAIKNSTIH